MRRMQLDKILPGMKLAKAVFTDEGRVLLTAGLEFKENFRERLMSSGITDLFIEDDISIGIEIPEIVCEETLNEAKSLVRSIMNNETFSSAFNITRINEVVTRIIDELLSSDNVLVNLSQIRSVDDYTFEHSVNVCILSLIIGISLGFNSGRLKDLGIGSILHDIGKMKVPQEILKKPSQLTVEEFEEIKKHTVYGYEILKESKCISTVSAFIAYAHHERYDGSGYPSMLKGENIHLCARIVAIADVYDALTSDRVYRKKLRPHEVLEYITALGSKHFDPNMVKEFTKYVAAFPVGTAVRLNSNERGIVVRVDKSMPLRPVIRIVYASDGKKINPLHEVDLTKNMNLYVLDTCEL